MTRNPCAHGLSHAFGSWLRSGVLHVAIEGPAPIQRRAAVVPVRREQAGAGQFVDAPTRDADVAGRGLGVQVALVFGGVVETVGDLLGDGGGQRLHEALVGPQNRQPDRTGALVGSLRSGHQRTSSPSQFTGLTGVASVRQIGANGPRSARSSSRQTETSTSGVSARSGSWRHSASTVRRRSSSRSLDRPAKTTSTVGKTG